MINQNNIHDRIIKLLKLKQSCLIHFYMVIGLIISNVHECIILQHPAQNIIYNKKSQNFNKNLSKYFYFMS